MQTPQNLEIQQVFNVCYRRKKLIIAVGLVVFSLATYLAVTLPNIYRSSTMILIAPQKLPPSYFRSISSMTQVQRVDAIIRQILSRSGLEHIIKEFDLFRPDNSGITMEQRIEALRKQIKIDVRHNDTFELAFTADGAQKAMQITARLASLFIEENHLAQERLTEDTKGFIKAEADRLRAELETRELQVNQIRAKYRFELPEQLDANLRNLDHYRRELESGLVRLASLRERKASLEKQLAETSLFDRELALIDPNGTGHSLSSTAKSLRRRELDLLLRQYSEKHPDVIRLKREIESLRENEATQEPKKPASNAPVSMGSSLKEMLGIQITDLKTEMEALQAQQTQLRDQIAQVQSRIESTPLRAAELSRTTRDYDITLRKYLDLQNKGLDTQISANMEKGQKGAQFEVIDPASFPEKPIGPKRGRIVIVGMVMGLVGGIGLAFLLDKVDTSLKTPDELESYAGVPLLAAIPAVATRGFVLEKRRSDGILVLASLTGLIVGMGAIRFYGHLLPGLF